MNRPLPRALLVALGLAAFCALFLAVDQAYFGFANARFPHVGSSAGLATLWGVVSRLHIIIPTLVVVLLRPRALGFCVGRIREHWRLLLGILVVNCGLVAGFLLLSGGTPYSGNQWLVTEVITVPLVEEIFWRGLVFAAVTAALRPVLAEGPSEHLTVWLTGIAFGALHAANALAGVPLGFAVIQAGSAMVWGVLYGYARSKTGSIYPPIILHAAMNLVVVLF
jgi:membrane protease YdiL (CAAX protease family)